MRSLEKLYGHNSIPPNPEIYSSWARRGDPPVRLQGVEAPVLHHRPRGVQHPGELPLLTYLQCDQMWRNFAAWATFFTLRHQNLSLLTVWQIFGQLLC